jgi:hypothetical protein
MGLVSVSDDLRHLTAVTSLAQYKAKDRPGEVGAQFVQLQLQCAQFAIAVCTVCAAIAVHLQLHSIETLVGVIGAY